MLKPEWLVKENQRLECEALERFQRKIESQGGYIMPEDQLDYDTSVKTFERLARSSTRYDDNANYPGYKGL